MIRIFLLGLLLLCPAIAQADASPPAAIYQTAPFTSNPEHMSSAKCNIKVNCNASDAEMLRIANECSNERLGFSPKMLTSFVHANGPYKNCAIPSTYAPLGPGLGAKAQWPICCETAAADGTCQMTCHYYMTNDFAG